MCHRQKFAENTTFFSGNFATVGIVHQVNIEYLAPVEYLGMTDGVASVYPDTRVGTDSHTTCRSFAHSN